MRAYVLTDPTLTRHAGRFVWLEIDTEKAKNAALRKRLGVSALPTFFVVDPADGRVALRWVGGFTARQLDRLLDDGAAAVRGAAGAGAPEAALLRADRLYADADYAGAARGYEEALAAAPGGWPPYARVVDALLYALSSADSGAAVARVARDAYPRVRGTPSAANVAASGLDAALGLPDTLAGRNDLVAAFESGAREVLADSTLDIAADDRSGVYVALLDARQDAKDAAGARRVAGEWAAFLEREAGRAATPEKRAVFDSHRLSAYLELGEPQRAIPALEASERDLPGDYNPPARLAVAYNAMKRWDEALAASDRALAKSYGPRRLGILSTRADILRDRGDRAAARQVLEQALSEAQALPTGQRSEGAIAALRKKLAALE
jgi:tetratricopeptide (TPR) repeat protein